MTTYKYDDSGTQLVEERRYSVIPNSGEGAAGTNYDSTSYGYDSMGRRWRTKEASGTIRRTVFDALGRTTDNYIGTNDHSFSGGSAGTTTWSRPRTSSMTAAAAAETTC